MQNLSRPDPVQNLEMKPVEPTPIDVRRQGFARGHAQSKGSEVVPVRRVLHLKHRRIEGRDAEEQRRMVSVDHLEDRVGRRSPREQHGFGADSHREVHVVAEAIREEEFRRRERAVSLRDPEDPPGVCLGADEHVTLEVHGAFRESRRPRRVQPERDVVFRGVDGLQPRSRIPDPFVKHEGEISSVLADDDDAPEQIRLGDRGIDLVQQRFRYDDDLRAAIV